MKCFMFLFIVTSDDYLYVDIHRAEFTELYNMKYKIAEKVSQDIYRVK